MGFIRRYKIFSIIIIFDRNFDCLKEWSIRFVIEKVSL